MLKDFLLQQIFPGYYASHINKSKLAKLYESQKNFDIDISSIKDKESIYIEQLNKDIDEQVERKKRIEDKAKSLLFIISVSVTAITFSLSNFNSIQENFHQVISLIILIVCVVYFMFGAIRAIQTLNIRQFHIVQSDIEVKDKSFILNAQKGDEDHLKQLIKNKQANDLINIQLSNYTYASFTLIRNGIIFLILFFITTVFFSYLTANKTNSNSKIINDKVKLHINDTLQIELPYSFEIKYELKNLKEN